MFIIQFNLPLKPLHLRRVLLSHELLDTAVVALRNMLGEPGVMRGSVEVGAAVDGAVVVGTVVVQVDSSYLYLQQPHLLVQQNQVAEQ